MQILIVPPEVRARLGTDASEGLATMFAQYHEFATDRFERRLTEEAAALRIQFHRDLERGLTGVRVEMERLRADLLKWTLLCWVGQFAAITAALSFMLDGR